MECPFCFGEDVTAGNFPYFSSAEYYCQTCHEVFNEGDVVWTCQECGEQTASKSLPEGWLDEALYTGRRVVACSVNCFTRLALREEMTA
jgi:hypothetical protein